MMRLQHFYFCAILLIGSSSLFAADCIGCAPTKVEGMPENKSLGGLETVVAKLVERKVANEDEDEGPVFKDYMDKFCMQFQQVNKNQVPKMLKEMDQSPHKTDRYFTTAQCQPTHYSESVKSPLLHYVADAPETRENFLNTIWLYYSKKRNQPEIFIEALNSKNSKGETLLDYMETLKLRKINLVEGQQNPIKNIIHFACEHGGTYSTYKNIKCPTP